MRIIKRMSKTAIFKVPLCVCLFLNYSPTISADGLISKSKSPANDDDVSTKENQNQLEIQRPGEKWIVVNEISCWESNDRWENVAVCSNSRIVTGHRFRFLSRTGLTGIQLKCTEKYGAGEKEKGEILEMVSKGEAGINLPRGEWENWNEESDSSFSVGFSFTPGEMNLRRSVKNFDMIYQSGNPREMVKKQSAANSNSGKVVTKCPQHHAICGITAMMDKAGLGILTSTGLKCCFHCVPEEKWVTVHQRNNSRPCNLKGQFNATVSVQQSPQDFFSQSIKLRKAFGSAETFQLLEQAKGFAQIRKSNLTDFDWNQTADSIWTDEKTVTEDYICGARSSCVFEQLVGQCEGVCVRIQKFNQDSNLIQTSSSESWINPESISCCSDASYAMENLPSHRTTKQVKYPHGNRTSLQVLCDFDVDDGGSGWTIIQKRRSGPTGDFNRNWSEYARGFGSLDGNFWLGLENIHALTKNGDQELRIELEDFEGEKRFAKYSNFSISDASDDYRLTIGGFSRNSTAGDSMTNASGNPKEILNGMRFTTKDLDNDKRYGLNCAGGGKGAWWHNSCSSSRLNGLYREKGETFPFAEGIIWHTWKGLRYSLAKTVIKIRKRKSE